MDNQQGKKKVNINLYSFLKKGTKPSKHTLMVRKDLVDKVKYLLSLRPLEDTSISDFYNNVMDYFFELHKEEIEDYIKECQKERSKFF